MNLKTQRIKIPNWTVKVTGWRELHIEQFYVKPTYLGVMEGSTRGINRAILQHLPKRASAVFCGGPDADAIPVHFTPLSEEQMDCPLPDFLCMALVTSEPVRDETYDEDTTHSRVVCCWFTSDLDRSIEAILLGGIHPFPWDACAQNWGV